MFCNKYDADKNFSYMDGIPVKISEQYKPPKKITVPSSILNRHSSESIEDYDFSLEKSMVKKMGEWRELRRTIAEKRKQRLESEEQCGNSERNGVAITETLSRLSVKSPEPVTGQQHQQLQPSVTVPVSQQEPPQCTSYHLQAVDQGVHSRSDPILTPVPVTSHSYYGNEIETCKTFNISEFESDTSSPFDNMELKTLNDIEELAHVLQPNLNSSNCDIPCSTLSQSHVDNAMARISTAGEESSLCKKTDDSHLPRINGMNLQYYSSYNHVNSNNVWPQYNLSHHTNHHHHQNHNHSNHNYVGALATWAQPVHPSSYNPNIQSYVVQRLDRLETDSQLQQVMAVSERSSKSVPDIIQELELELKDKRASEKQRLKKIISQPTRPTSIGSTEIDLKAKSSLPNPLNQLTPSCQQLTMRLNEMGFPLARVARAVQRFGDNETRVLEFLLQIQSLEEGGCPADRAELALIANNYILSETVRYLETLKQLLDLGFVEGKVMEALEKHFNDRDKALESLIS